MSDEVNNLPSDSDEEYGVIVFTDDDDSEDEQVESLKDEEEEEEDHWAYFENTWAFSKSLGLAGVALGAAFAVTALFVSDGPIRLGRLIAFPAAAGVGIGALSTGLHLLFAPRKIWDTPTGRGYMALVGTKNLLLARAVIALFVLFGFGIIAVLVMGFLDMLNLIE